VKVGLVNVSLTNKKVWYISRVPGSVRSLLVDVAVEVAYSDLVTLTLLEVVALSAAGLEEVGALLGVT
jgi:hypothetical protein